MHARLGGDPQEPLAPVSGPIPAAAGWNTLLRRTRPSSQPGDLSGAIGTLVF